MSFESRDLMIDVLPTGKFRALAQPGFALCGQVTSAGGDEDDDEEEDDLDCGQITSNTGPTSVSRTGMELALLRRQLRETLSV